MKIPNSRIMLVDKSIPNRKVTVRLLHSVYKGVAEAGTKNKAANVFQSARPNMTRVRYLLDDKEHGLDVSSHIRDIDKTARSALV